MHYNIVILRCLSPVARKFVEAIGNNAKDGLVYRQIPKWISASNIFNCPNELYTVDVESASKFIYMQVE